MSPQELKDLAKALLEAGKMGDFLSLVLFEARPSVRPIEGPLGPIYRRPMLFPEIGSKIQGHTHKYDHVTVLHRGALLVKYYPDTPNGKANRAEKEAIFECRNAPVEILILANTFHEFTALERDTWATCYFVHRDQLGAPVQAYNGRKGSYA